MDGTFVDADSSQIEAIEMAKSGKSFVLQGPPGTGKSQTITNIIAECLGDGKKVLFVSEKLAALNVVFEKLKQARLEEFCLELHSHKANKKDVIADICRTLRAEKNLSRQKLSIQFGTVLSRLFNAEYRQLIKGMKLCRRDRKKVTYVEAVAFADRLSVYQQKCKEYTELEAPVVDLLGVGYRGVDTDWDYVMNQMRALNVIILENESFGQLESCLDFISEKNNFKMYAERLKTVFSDLDHDNLDFVADLFDDTFLDTRNDSCKLIMNRLNSCMNELDKMDNLFSRLSRVFLCRRSVLVLFCHRTQFILMRQLRLRWHYRSRYEQLIAFSNKNFYDNSLVTFPSAKTDAKGIGVDYYHVDGIFDRRSHTNREEAEFVVDLIYQSIEKHPERSLGVVAFSIAQQELIDNLLSKKRQALCKSLMSGRCLDAKVVVLSEKMVFYIWTMEKTFNSVH